MLVKSSPDINIIPAKGLNVYDILRHKTVICTRDALDDIVARLARPISRGFKRRSESWRQRAAQELARRRLEERQRGEIAEWLAARGVAAPAPLPAEAAQQGLGQKAAGGSESDFKAQGVGELT